MEKDALRFIFAVNESYHIQIDWDFIKPLFARTIRFKGSNQILQLFEQVKNKIVLNKANENLAEGKEELLFKLKSEFYK